MSFVCKTCQEGGRNDNVTINANVDASFDGVQVVENFSYLGDTLQKDGGCERAVAERIRKGWWKFKELSGILCNRRLGLKMRGNLYRTCVRTVITYGCECWPIKKENEDTLKRAERRMIRMMCGVTLRNRVSSQNLQERLGLNEDISVVLKKARLRWFGHVYRREEDAGIRKEFLFDAGGRLGRGRPRKTWYELIKGDLKDYGLCEKDALDRGFWRNTIRDTPANPRPRGKRQ